MDIRDLESIIARTGDLPAMPGIAVKVMEMVGDPGTSAKDLQEVISHDQALTTKVLKIANSAMFGVSRDISTLSHAIMILGFSTIRSIVLATSTKSIYLKGKSTGGFSMKLLWDHSIGCALVARRLARETHTVNLEEAFIAGLLHDIGKTVINLLFASRYEEVISQVYNGGESFATVENRLMGFDHTQVGALVLRKWNLSRSLEDAVLHHHDPANATANPKLTAVVSLANSYCKKLGIGPETRENEVLAEHPAAHILEFAPAMVDELLQAVLQLVEEDKEIFEL
jgi:putative nucleotidyltransferase with HDIG domain